MNERSVMQLDALLAIRRYEGTEPTSDLIAGVLHASTPQHTWTVDPEAQHITRDGKHFGDLAQLEFEAGEDYSDCAPDYEPTDALIFRPAFETPEQALVRERRAERDYEMEEAA